MVEFSPASRPEAPVGAGIPQQQSLSVNSTTPQLDAKKLNLFLN
jgi:hypothetical protein